MSKLKDASVVVRTAATELQVGHSITHDPGRRALLGRSAAVAALGMAGLEGAAQMRRRWRCPTRCGPWAGPCPRTSTVCPPSTRRT